MNVPRTDKRLLVRGLLALRRIPMAARLLLAVGLMALLYGVQTLAVGLNGSVQYVTVFGGVLLSAILFGLLPALLAAVVGWLVEVIWFIEPIGQLSIRDELDLYIALLLLGWAFFAAILIEVLLRGTGVFEKNR